MKRAILGAVFALFAALLVMPTSAFASEENAQAAYQSYQTAMQNGELRTARDFAREGYEEALATYGNGSPEFDRYAAAYARALNDLLDYGEVLSVLDPHIKAREAVEEFEPWSFEVLFESGRALWGHNQFGEARQLFEGALATAEEIYGPQSIEVANAHLELARAYHDRSSPIEGDSWRYQVVGSGYPYLPGSMESLERAAEIFSQNPTRNVELEILSMTRGAYELAAGNRDLAGSSIEPAIEALAAGGYMDDYVLTIFIDWVASHLTDWPSRRMERALLRAIEYGSLRQEGLPLPLVRIAAVSHRRVCIDDINGGYALMEYSVNSEGQVPRTRAVETDLPDWWIDDQRRQLRRWSFVPAQAAGEAIRVDGLRMYGRAARADSC